MNRVEFVLWMCCAASCFGACLAGIRIDDLIWFDICLSPETLKSVDLNRVRSKTQIEQSKRSNFMFQRFTELGISMNIHIMTRLSIALNARKLSILLQARTTHFGPRLSIIRKIITEEYM